MKTGKLSRAEFRELMVPVRKHVELLLERGRAAKLALVSSTAPRCGPSSTTKASSPPTITLNASCGPSSSGASAASGRRASAATWLMTVAHTARKQNKNVLAFLTACCTAARTGATPPSLLAAA